MPNRISTPYGVVTPAALLTTIKTETRRSLPTGMWSHRSVAADFNGGIAAHAHVWSAPSALWPDRKINLDDLFHRCLTESPGAGAVAYLAMLETNGGVLEEMLDKHGTRPDRVLILDWVEVDPRWRGHAIGRRLAARCLYVAGAFDRSALVLSLPARNDDPGCEFVETRSCRLLAGLGLTRTPTGLWAGLCSMTRAGACIEQYALG